MKPLLLLAFFSIAPADVAFLEPDTLLFYDSAYVIESIIGPSDTADDCTQEHPCYLSLDFNNRRHGPILHYVASEGDLFTFGCEFPLYLYPERPTHATLAFYDWKNTLRGSTRITLGYKDPKPNTVQSKAVAPALPAAAAWRVDGRRL